MVWVTVYTSSPQTGFVVLAQTEEERRVKMEKEWEFYFNHTTKDSLANNEGHQHEEVTVHIVSNKMAYCPRVEVTETHHRQAGTGGMVLMVTGEWLLILLIVLDTILLSLCLSWRAGNLSWYSVHCNDKANDRIKIN
jgi:hypothetical protein